MIITESQYKTNATDGIYTLPKLSYAYDALEEYIDAQTMELHHSKHHNTYVTKLNEAIAKHPHLSSMSVEELVMKLNDMPEDIRGAVRNHGGGHANHTLFWDVLTSKSTNMSTDLQSAVDGAFGNTDNMLEKLNTSAISVFGSGWAWLALNAEKNLIVTATPNQDTPLMQGMIPVFGIDVWEHAYYLRYQNRRPDYVSSILKAINWDSVSSRYNDALKVIN